MLNQSARIFIDTIPGLGVEIWQLDKTAPEAPKTLPGDWRINVTGTFNDRDERGASVRLSRVHYYRWPNKVPTKMQLARVIRKVLRKHLKHEIDEGLWVDGELVFDPHEKD
jgi:hypothetical protein